MSPASADEAPSGSRCSRPVLEDASVSSAAPAPVGRRAYDRSVHWRSAFSLFASTRHQAGTCGPPGGRTNKLLLEGPIFATLLRLAAPNILNLIAFVAVIIFDGFFLGRIGTDALAGASLAFPWIMLVLQTTNSGMGAGGVVRRRARSRSGQSRARRRTDLPRLPAGSRACPQFFRQ